ncbi:hypothetical protein E2C01_000256 [Portunus trituberculatus]|uniref:Uncharacterized protein n=1 Tax=Portunus trituberculatus TaxID=210409 RepID=A0A5B7CG09_PORTR|nr:hypothetical protein [Portunus trituberculatus]
MCTRHRGEVNVVAGGLTGREGPPAASRDQGKRTGASRTAGTSRRCRTEGGCTAPPQPDIKFSAQLLVKQRSVKRCEVWPLAPDAERGRAKKVDKDGHKGRGIAFQCGSVCLRCS